MKKANKANPADAPKARAADLRRYPKIVFENGDRMIFANYREKNSVPFVSGLFRLSFSLQPDYFSSSAFCILSSAFCTASRP
jgi:hypothetical protein